MSLLSIPRIGCNHSTVTHNFLYLDLKIKLSFESYRVTTLGIAKVAGVAVIVKHWHTG